MVPRLECALPSLLCAEDITIIHDDDDYHDVVYSDGDEETSEQRNHHQMNDQNQLVSKDDASEFNDLPLQSEEIFTMMVNKECEFLPASDYLRRLKNGDLDSEARMDAIDWIAKVQAYYNFGPLCAYLSTTYLDRFLSAYELPKGKAWMIQLLAVACLSLAAKLEETEVPLSLDLQVGKSEFVFEAKTIQRMELLVLSTLKWKMQAVTPFSFINYYLEKINGDHKTSRSLIAKSTKLILSVIREIDYLEFKPSEIAAAVAIYVAGETQTADAALVHRVEKDKLMKCVELMKDLKKFDIVASASMSFEPQSPIGVLDAANSPSHNSPIAKRRKLN